MCIFVFNKSTLVVFFLSHLECLRFPKYFYLFSLALFSLAGCNFYLFCARFISSSFPRYSVFFFVLLTLSVSIVVDLSNRLYAYVNARYYKLITIEKKTEMPVRML